MMQTYDIIVAGAGPVGASMACALAPLGLRVALVEAKTLPFAARKEHFDTRSIALTYGSTQLLEAWGVWSALCLSATPIHQVHVSERGVWGKTVLKASDFKVSALGFVIPFSRLLHRLQIECINLAPLITLYGDYRVTQVSYEDAWTTVSIVGIDGTQTLRARLLIVAEGAESSVRNALGIAAETRDYQQTAIAVNVGISQAHQGVAYERFLPSGPIAMLPHKEHKVGMIWALPTAEAEMMMQQEESAFLASVQSVFGFRLGRFTNLGCRQKFPLRLLKAEQQSRAGVVLIGNAAHVIHPMAAQGFNLGLRDVAVLTRLITKATASKRSFWDEKLLKQYSDLRVTDQQMLLRFTNSLHDVFRQDFLGFSCLRGMSLSALNMCLPVKRYLGRRLMGLDIPGVVTQ